MGAVLEEVGDGHGAVAELVHEGGLKLPLDKVSNHHPEDQALEKEEEEEEKIQTRIRRGDEREKKE